MIISFITSEPGYADMYSKTFLGQIIIVVLGIGLFRSAVYGRIFQIVSELLSNKYGNEIYMFQVEIKDLGKEYIDLFIKYK